MVHCLYSWEKHIVLEEEWPEGIDQAQHAVCWLSPLPGGFPGRIVFDTALLMTTHYLTEFVNASRERHLLRMVEILLAMGREPREFALHCDLIESDADPVVANHKTNRYLLPRTACKRLPMDVSAILHKAFGSLRDEPAIRRLLEGDVGTECLETVESLFKSEDFQNRIIEAKADPHYQHCANDRCGKPFHNPAGGKRLHCSDPCKRQSSRNRLQRKCGRCGAKLTRAGDQMICSNIKCPPPASRFALKK